MGCPSPERLQLLIESSAPSPERDVVVVHAETCAPCRGVVVALFRNRVPAPPGASVAPDELASGTTIGRYVIDRRLGAGAMGVVYVARDPELERDVAVKLLRRDGVGEPRQMRLYREAQAAARIAHPNVVAVHDVGIYADQVFVTMELVRGVTLRRWLEHPRSWREVLGVAIQAGRGLAAVHASGLVHRDFKPDNILVGDDGRVRVTDFGLVRSTDDPTEPAFTSAPPLDRVATEAGAFVGTPAYAAPEQLRGHAADARSDQFAFAVTIWEAVFGQRPFTTNTLGELVQRPMATSARAPARLVTVLRRALSEAPSARFPSVDAMLAELTRIERRRPAVAIAGAAMLAAVPIAIAFAVRTPAPAPTSCDDLADVDGLWNAGARRRLERSFAATGHPRAASRAAELSAALDRVARRWQTIKVEACKGSAASVAVQTRCLGERRTELADAIAELVTPSGIDVVEWAADATLPDPTDCGPAIETVMQPPPAIAAEVAATRRALARTSLTLSLYGPKHSAAELVDATERANVLEYAPLTAEVHLVVARAAWLAGDARSAARELRLARDGAARGHDVRRSTEATVRLVGALAATGEIAEAERVVETAVALLRPGTANELDLELARGAASLAARGRSGDAIGSLAEAVPLLERALASAERGGATGPRVAGILDELAAVLTRLDRHGEADAARARASAIWAVHDGPDAIPRLLEARQRAVLAANHRRGYELAARLLAAAERQPRTPPSELAAHHRALAASAANLGDWRTARASYRRAAERGERAGDVARDLDAAAWAAQRLGEAAAAVEDARQAVVVVRTDAGDLDRWEARFALGRALAYAGRLDDAIRELSDVVDRIDANVEPRERGLARHALAELLWRRHPDRPRARALATAAVADLEASGACFVRPHHPAIVISTGGFLGLVITTSIQSDGSFAGTAYDNAMTGTWSSITNELTMHRVVNHDYVQIWRADIAPYVMTGWFVERISGHDVPNHFDFQIACDLDVTTGGRRARFAISTLTTDGSFTGTIGDDEISGRWDQRAKQLSFTRVTARGSEAWTGRWTGGLTFSGTYQDGRTTASWTMQPR